MSNGGKKRSRFSSGEHAFFVLLDDRDILYLCLSSSKSQTQPFFYLEAVKASFVAKFGYDRIFQCRDLYELNEDFALSLQALAANAEQLKEQDIATTVINQIENVKDRMISNIDKMLERGNQIDSLINKSEQLSEEVR